MKEFVEKLLNELNYKKEYNQIVYDAKPRTKHEKDLNVVLQSTYDSAIRIAKRLAGEYSVGEENAHTGWIPCSERLPEGKESHKVLVTDEDGIMAVCYFLEVTKIFKVCWDGEEFQGVVAWQPLPEPYQPKGE